MHNLRVSVRLTKTRQAAWRTILSLGRKKICLSTKIVRQEAMLVLVSLSETRRLPTSVTFAPVQMIVSELNRNICNLVWQYNWQEHQRYILLYYPTGVDTTRLLNLCQPSLGAPKVYFTILYPTGINKENRLQYLWSLLSNYTTYSMYQQT